MDVKTLRLNTIRMIHPVLLNKLKNKGISVILNTITGFDCEYELESIENMTNKLISIQLATTTNLYIKVPIIDTKPVNVLNADKIDSF